MGAQHNFCLVIGESSMSKQTPWGRQPSWGGKDSRHKPRNVQNPSNHPNWKKGGSFPSAVKGLCPLLGADFQVAASREPGTTVSVSSCWDCYHIISASLLSHLQRTGLRKCKHLRNFRGGVWLRSQEFAWLAEDLGSILTTEDKPKPLCRCSQGCKAWSLFARSVPVSVVDSLNPVWLELILWKKHNLEAKQNRSYWPLGQEARRAGSLALTGPQRILCKTGGSGKQVPPTTCGTCPP